ncbi:MAG: chemotaxis protein CheD [Bacillota bacterium]|nr:chemotaxis protein CheD [Bacillota bacterium]
MLEVMGTKVIGIGEYAITDTHGDVIITYALATCVAMTVYSPIRRVAGMVHISLPETTKHIETKEPNIWSYADTAVPMLIQYVCYRYGCNKGELDIRIYGGADSAQKSDIFKIGRRNVDAVSHALSLLDLNLNYCDVGGNKSRTIELFSDTGKVNVRYLPLRV